jgi:hypothetical protein
MRFSEWIIKKKVQLFYRINPDLFLSVHIRVLIISIFILGIVVPSVAQREGGRRGSRVIDDSTRQVYGPTTSRYYFERDVFYNRDEYHHIDTFIRNFHRFNYVQKYENLYQDLGNIGTSIQPIFYKSPSVIGVKSGFQSYDLYWDDEVLKYYDTKSPFTNLDVDLGGGGRASTRVSFSRNINPRWNFGFTYRGLFIDKQIQRRGKGDRHAKATYYDMYTAYQSKDSTYRLFLNFRRMYHQVDEYGGVLESRVSQFSDFFAEDAEPSLREAESNDLRANLHFAHQYKIGKALQLYHQFDLYEQTNQFVNDYANEAHAADYFDYDEMDALSVRGTYDEAEFRTNRNEVGIKGSLLKLFYNGFYAIRNYQMNYNLLEEDTLLVRTKGSESYLGGRVSFKLDSLVEVNGLLEVQQEGNLRIEGEIKSRWFEASLKQTLYEPTFAQQAYRGSHDSWNNSFDKVESTWLNGYLHYNSRWLSVSPGVTFTRLRNYVYFREIDVDFGQTVLPFQSSGNQIYVAPEFNVSFTFLKHIILSGRGIYTHILENNDDALQLPELFVNGQLAYANIFFNGNLDMHAGAEVHWKSSYYAPGYDVASRQFYTQTTIKVPAFPVIDIFFNAKIKRGRIFLKYHNLVQVFTKEGYLPTPYYPGQKNIVDFGFDWQFYD